jgi:hypothetical protein
MRSPLFNPHIKTERIRSMRNNTPVFSSYLKLRHTNPDAYHCANTIEQMISLQRKHGHKFYDLPQHRRDTL